MGHLKQSEVTRLTLRSKFFRGGLSKRFLRVGKQAAISARPASIMLQYSCVDIATVECCEIKKVTYVGRTYGQYLLLGHILFLLGK